MNIRILHLLEGARQARGITVIIDVFRAFTTEAYLMEQGARRILPVGAVSEALAYKQAHPDAILCGERGGRIIDGFDLGNSPSQVENRDFTGKTVVHTTSAGTQGIANAIHADQILGGSLVCAKAIGTYIRQLDPPEVSLVCMGLDGKTKTAEDTFCACYIQALLEGRPLPDTGEAIDLMKRTSGAKFFDPSQQDVFPERDFHLSVRQDIFPFVLRLQQDAETGLCFMERICI